LQLEMQQAQSKHGSGDSVDLIAFVLEAAEGVAHLGLTHVRLFALHPIYQSSVMVLMSLGL